MENYLFYLTKLPSLSPVPGAWLWSSHLISLLRSPPSYITVSLSRIFPPSTEPSDQVIFVNQEQESSNKNLCSVTGIERQNLHLFCISVTTYWAYIVGGWPWDRMNEQHGWPFTLSTNKLPRSITITKSSTFVILIMALGEGGAKMVEE